MKQLKRLPVWEYAGIVSFITLIAHNSPLLGHVWETGGMGVWERSVVTMTIVVVKMLLGIVTTGLLVSFLGRVGRAVISVQMVLNAVASYCIRTYNIMLSPAILSSVYSTRYIEASSFVTWRMVAYVLCLGVIPAIWVALQPVESVSKRRLSVASVVAIGAIAIVAVAKREYLDRNEREIAGLSLPWAYVGNTGAMIYAHLQATEEQPMVAGMTEGETSGAVGVGTDEAEREGDISLKVETAGDVDVEQSGERVQARGEMASAPEVQQSKRASEGEHRHGEKASVETTEETRKSAEVATAKERVAVVVVIGESARRANFQLYGYERATNPLLSEQSGVSALRAESEATITIASLRAMLVAYGEGRQTENLPNYLERVGCDVEWRTTNWGEPKVNTTNYLREDSLHRLYPDEDATVDGILFHGVKERIERSESSKVFIVLHTYSGHCPNYCSRIPKSFYRYTPVIDNIEGAQADPQPLVNAYDNSIVYMDYLLSSLIDSLRSMGEWRTAMLYVSDHGEMLGEGGHYMHGVPKFAASPLEYEIPFIVWTSEGYRRIKKDLGTIGHSHIFHSVVNLLSVKSPIYKPELDIFEPESDGKQ